MVLGIEEPEANLHPQAQREHVSSFREMIGTERQVQVLFTTHSAVMVDQLDHEEVVLVRKDADQERGVTSTITQLEAGFLQRHGMGDQRYYRFHRFENSDFFFARLIVVVEGEVDADVVRQLLVDADCDPDRKGITILPLYGAENLPYVFHLLTELDLPRFFILAKDHFVPYSNGDLAGSRDGSGFPRYRYGVQGRLSN